MKNILLLLVFLCGFCPVSAQLSSAQVLDTINTRLPDNNSRQIKPRDFRAVFSTVTNYISSVAATGIGSIGPVGPIGPQGTAGTAGPIGPQGSAGTAGPIGPQGIAGIPGPIGPQGIAGIPGPIGLQGTAGTAGPIGPQGTAGTPGADGLTGPEVSTAIATAFADPANQTQFSQTDFSTGTGGEILINPARLSGTAATVNWTELVGPTPNVSIFANNSGYVTQAAITAAEKEFEFVGFPSVVTTGIKTTITAPTAGGTTDATPVQSSTNAIQSGYVYTLANTVAANNTRLNGLTPADIAGLQATLSNLQSQINALNGSTTPNPATAGIVDDVANTYDWTNSTTGGLTLADYEYTLNGGATYTVATAKPITVGNVALGIGQVGVRVKAAAGRNVSTTLYNTTAYTTSGTYTAGTPIRIAFQASNTAGSIISTGSIQDTGTWNRMLPTQTNITTGNSYTLSNLVNENNVATTYSIGLGAPFVSNTASAIAAGATGIYPDAVLLRAYQSNLATPGSVILSGLNPNDYVQVYVYGGSGSTAVATYTVTGLTATTSANKTLTNNTGAGGGLETDPNTALVYFQNVQPTAGGTITIRTNYISGSNSNLNAVMFRTSTAPKP